MSDFFAKWGRKLGQASGPTLRKSKWIWQSVAGTEEESIKAELDFGMALAAELRTTLCQSPHPKDDALIQEIGRNLSHRLRDKLRTFKIETMESQFPSAMGVPGGFVFVDVTLLDLCQRDPDELAFVIGHEMAHIIRRHTLERMVRQVGVDMISAVAGRGALKLWMRKTGMKLLQSAHSRGCELDADAFGALMAAKSGYDREGAIRVLERLKQWRASTDNLGEYLESHPPEEERIANLKAVT